MTEPRKQCPEFERLQREVTEVLAKITEITTAQREAFRAKDSTTFARLDKELENIMGSKERVIGALRQHVKEHRCQEAAASAPGL